MKIESTNFRISEPGQRSPSRAIGCLVSVMVVAGLSACGGTSLFGGANKKLDAKPPAPLGTNQEQNKQSYPSSGAAEVGTKTIVVPSAIASVVPSVTDKTEPSAGEMVMEVVHHRLASSSPFYDTINIAGDAKVFSHEEWRAASLSPTRNTSYPTGRAVYNKDQNCVVISINDGPDIDFGCNQSFGAVSNFDTFDKEGIKTVKKTVKALPKGYCNKVRVKVTSEMVVFPANFVPKPDEKILIKTWRRDISTDGIMTHSMGQINLPSASHLTEQTGISTAETTEADGVKGGKRWRFHAPMLTQNGGKYNTANYGNRQTSDTKTGITLQTNPHPFGFNNTYLTDEESERNSIRFDLNSNDTMNFALENSLGCNDKTLLPPK